jgi:hypothetical protein
MADKNPSILQSAIPNPPVVGSCRQSAIDGCSLCQPDPSKSCGACCGLYNWEDHSRKALIPLLEKRLGLFSSLGRDPEIFQAAYARAIFPPGRKLLEEIHNCEFLGFLDGEKKRVGCLLHPSANEGRDLRDYCFYGKEICAGHFCPSHTHLTRGEQKSVVAALEDWYLYGLVITDIDLVKEFFHHVQNRLGDSLREEGWEREKVRGALRGFFGLKESWKFASSRKRLGKYYFSHSEYQVARIEYEKNWRIKPSRFDKILVSLESDFQTPEEVLEAEAMIEERICGFLEAYEEGT